MQRYISNLIKVNGFVTLDEFIATALCHPLHGYYAKQNPIQKDFTTSPEISNAFGIIIASFFLNKILSIKNHELYEEIHFIEFGGGSGKLAFDVINFLISTNKINNEKINSIIKKINFHSIEFSDTLKLIQKNKLINLKIPKYFWNNISELFSFFNNSQKSKNNFHVFFSNEFFDALPIKQFFFNGGNFFENIITENNNNFIFEGLKVNFEKSELITKLKLIQKNIQDGTIFEVPIVGMQIVEEISSFIQNNPSMFITFDYTAPHFTGGSTLQGIYCGQKTTEILQNVGNTDITHLVDFSIFQNIFINHKITTQLCTQREFLIQNDIEALIDGNTSEGINRLIDATQMGSLFKVLVAEKFQS